MVIEAIIVFLGNKRSRRDFQAGTEEKGSLYSAEAEDEVLLLKSLHKGHCMKRKPHIRNKQ